jgi:uncharacterized protein with HXXEE motif
MKENANIAILSATDPRQLVRWFALLVLIGPIHMGEQMLSGLDTLDELNTMMAAYYSRFTNPDVGTVALVIVVVTFVQLLLLGALAGGRWRLFVAGVFGLMAVAEAHHVAQTLVQGKYFPGLVTSLGYVWIGVMVLRAVVRDWNAATRQVQKQFAVA